MYLSPIYTANKATRQLLFRANPYSSFTGRRSALDPAAKIHARLMKSGANTDAYIWNKILMAYSKSSGIAGARKLFDEIPNPDTVSWNSLIAAHVSRGACDQAWRLLGVMMSNELTFDQYTLGSILKSAASESRIDLGRQLHSLAVKSALDRNVFSGSAMVDMYVKCGRMDDAYLLFALMPDPNTVSWNAVLAGYAHLGELKFAFLLFDRMEREGFVPDEATFSSILTLLVEPACYKLMSQVHAKIMKFGRVTDTIVYNAAITAYSQCGSISDSRKIFEDMEANRDLVTWNSMLAAYVCHGLTEDAIKLFVQMQELSFDQDMYTFTSVISACFEDDQHGQAVVLHGLVIKRGLEYATPVSNALIAMYVRSKDNFTMEDSIKCFGSMESRDIVTWNSILTGLSQNGLGEEALKFFGHMRSVRLNTDHYALSAILRSCSDLAVFQLGQQVHGLVFKSGFGSNDFVASSLIYMYSKCGVIDDARKSFDETGKESSVTWNSIIFGYAQHGHGKTSLNLFYEMQELEVQPDHITFVGLLSACSHIGLVEEGEMFLNVMQSIYGVPLRMEHYACGVDLFGRAGQLDKAIKLIESMPFEPTAMVWMTLLGACKTYANIELANHVGRHLLELDSGEHSIYVLLSSIYADFGMWDDRAMIQRMMRNRGVNKVPGWSWIEIKNKVHSFNAEDRSHPQAEEIYEMLRSLMEEIEITDYDHFDKAWILDLEFASEEL